MTGSTTVEKKITYLTTVKISSVKNSAKKCAVVKYKKNSKAGGYEVSYSTKSNFKGAKSVKVNSAKKLTATLKKLTKGKKYYVRVRTYKKNGAVTSYSVWSSSKKVTINK